MNKTKITPVKKRTVPKYPDQYSVQLNHLLLANKPLRWKAVPVAGTVLSAVVMLGLAGCTDKPVTMGDPAPPPFQTPFFEHGSGIGAYGCVMVTAPVFLSEDDAFAIIRDEFEKLNMTVVQGGGTVGNLQIPVIDYKGQIKRTEKKELEFDFAVQDKNIVMEYVSIRDSSIWRPKDNDGWESSVSSFNVKEAARTLNNSLNDMVFGNTHGVFYDPVEYAEDPWESVERHEGESNESYYARVKEARAQLEAEARERAVETLREQVKDFIAWLAAQGII